MDPLSRGDRHDSERLQWRECQSSRKQKIKDDKQ